MQQFHCYQFKRVSPILLKGKVKKNHSYLGGSIRIILSGKVFWRQRVKVFTYCLVWDLFQSLTLKVEHRIIKHQYCEAIRNNTERDFVHLGGSDWYLTLLFQRKNYPPTSRQGSSRVPDIRTGQPHCLSSIY